MRLEDVVLYMKPGVYILVDDIQKLVYINYSNSVLEGIVRFLRDRQYRPDLEIKLVSESDDIVTQRMIADQYKRHYSSLGYTILNNVKTFSWRYGIALKGNRAIVYLQNGQRDKYIVGVFKYMSKANEFIDQYYKNGIKSIIIGKNKRTKLEYSTKKFKNDFKYF